MLTLQSARNEGHLPYLSQSGSPGKETTWGGRTDDPRREHTRDAAAGHSSCDVASSYGVARILPELSAAAVAAFLRTVVVPAVRQAGWSVERVLTDGGGEFKAEFAAACAALGIRHTRIKPRHAWTNGFVENTKPSLDRLVSPCVSSNKSET